MKKDEKYWKDKLSDQQYQVCRLKATEPAFTGKYVNHHEDGSYMCIACKSELFSSGAKFDSGTGWPSFSDPKNTKNIELKEDTSHGMQRTEVLCKTCGSHLGHVFDDGPTPSGKRYCINSVALNFKAKKARHGFGKSWHEHQDP